MQCLVPLPGGDYDRKPGPTYREPPLHL